MSWIEDRETLEAHIPEVWDLLCIALEQSAEQFGQTAYARANKLFATAKRINTCVHIVLAPIGASAGKSIDVCLDKQSKRVFSRDKGIEITYLRFEGVVDGNVCIVRPSEGSVTIDRAAEIFLRPFLFAESP